MAAALLKRLGGVAVRGPQTGRRRGANAAGRRSEGGRGGRAGDAGEVARVAALAAWALLALGGRLAAQPATPIAWGQVPVAEVRILAPPSLGERAERLFAISPGQVVTRADLRAGVQALLASGEFVDAAVRAETTEGGLRLEVEATAAERLAEVRLEGVRGGLRRRLATVLDLTPGGVLDRTSLEASLEEARRLLQGAGYPQARVEASYASRGDARAVAVYVLVELGQPRTVGGVSAPGLPLTAESLQRITGLAPQKVLSEVLLERARRRLASSLRRQGWWAAEVRAPRLEGSEGPVLVNLAVQLGPRYSLDLTGVKPDKALLASALPFMRGGEAFDEGDLESVLRRLKLHLQERGYLRAQASGEVIATEGGRVLRIVVSQVNRRAIGGVRFPGLEGLEERELKEKVGVRRGRPWAWGREPVTTESLEWDRQSILTVLQQEGWADAQVEAARLVEDKSGVVVEFPVTMGERRRVAELEIEGVPEAILLPPLPLWRGGPWSRSGEEETRAAVLAALRDAGFLDARVSVARQCEGPACTVRVSATAGLQVVVDRVVVAGTVHTSERVVRRVATLRTGEPFGAAQALETQRRLLGLGLFQSATVRPIPGQEHQPRRGVVIELKEAPLRSYGFGLGWDTEAGVRASASWSHANLFGRGGALLGEASYSKRRKRLQLSYREPGPLALFGVPVWFSLYRYEGDFDTYRLLERGVWLELGDRERRPGRLAVRYEYQIVAPEAPPEVLSGLEREKQSLKIASLIPYAVWDSRDDLFAPRRGVLARAEFQSAFRILLAEAAFDKVSGFAAGYLPLGRGVLAAALRGGVAVPRNPEPGVGDNLALPINVRFFAGGQVSHRAFALDRLGVPGQTLDSRGNPVGGAAMLLTNLEWRRPLTGPLGLSLFVDGGNVWASRRTVRVDEMRWGAGLGVRFDTPVGPIRLEYGFKLDRLPRESRGELFFAFGNPF